MMKQMIILISSILLATTCFAEAYYKIEVCLRNLTASPIDVRSAPDQLDGPQYAGFTAGHVHLNPGPSQKYVCTTSRGPDVLKYDTICQNVSFAIRGSDEPPFSFSSWENDCNNIYTHANSMKFTAYWGQNCAALAGKGGWHQEKGKFCIVMDSYTTLN